MKIILAKNTSTNEIEEINIKDWKTEKKDKRDGRGHKIYVFQGYKGSATTKSKETTTRSLDEGGEKNESNTNTSTTNPKTQKKNAAASGKSKSKAKK